MTTDLRRIGVVTLAVGLAGAGAAWSIWRPLADLRPVASSPLATFDAALLEMIGRYRPPRVFEAVVALVLAVVVPSAVAFVPAIRDRLPSPGWATGRPSLRAAVQVAAVALLVALLQLPGAYRIGFRWERTFGFRTDTFGAWARDHLLSTLLTLAVAALTGAALSWLLRRRPTDWHLVLVPAATLLTALLALANPVVIDPLFLETTPLTEGPYRVAIEEVLDRAGAADLPIEVGDASRRTTKANAFVTGIGPTRRVVVWDTLLRLEPEVVASVVAHEYAHRSHRDVPRAVLLTATGTLVVGFALRRLLGSRLARRVVGDDGAAHPDAVLVVVAAVALAQVVGLPVSNVVSRRAEAAADQVALELADAPATWIDLTRGFVVRDLSAPSPPTWERLLFGSHPTPSERIRTAVAYARERGIELPSLAQFEEAERSSRWQEPPDGGGTGPR